MKQLVTFGRQHFEPANGALGEHQTDTGGMRLENAASASPRQNQSLGSQSPPGGAHPLREAMVWYTPARCQGNPHQGGLVPDRASAAAAALRDEMAGDLLMGEVGRFGCFRSTHPCRKSAARCEQSTPTKSAQVMMPTTALTVPHDRKATKYGRRYEDFAERKSSLNEGSCLAATKSIRCALEARLVDY